MTLRRSALVRCLLLAAMLRTESGMAGVWITTPDVGLAGEFSTNPGLLYVPHTSETDGAILLDAPTAYHEDNESFTIQPSLRIADESGYSSLTSDYGHLTGVGEIDDELGSLIMTAQIARDSSLYYNYSLNGSQGVRRDTTSADIAWNRSLTERWSFNWDINSSRVIYGQATSFTTLTDYHYSSATPGLSWNADERTVVKVLSSVGIYDSTNRETKSLNANAQLGVVRQLTESWTLTAAAGYSRENNLISGYEYVPVFVGPFLIGFRKVFVQLKSSENGTIFTANLTRKGELLSISAAATRSVVPTGFAFLATQTTYAVNFDYPRTERWTFDGSVQRTTLKEPQEFSATINDSYTSESLSAAWLMTEKWSLKLQVTHVNAHYSPPFVNVASSGVSLQLTRQFDPIPWQ
ncbi:MAG TPA: hypothetical protein VK437_10970 [Steroidobacteraceae bacterium]|nr:hypothetical protein [Steroidobacteraceae bacterium]